jgi:hypothetical protein
MTFSKLLAGQRIAAERTFRIALPLPLLGEGIPAIVVRHCGEENPAFYNAWRKRLIMRGGQPATTERLQREIDAPIIGTYGIVAMEHIYEDGPDGSPVLVGFTAAKATEFVIALAADAPKVFAGLRAITQDDDYFRDQPLPDAEAVGKE